MSYQALSLNGSGYASIADGSQAGLNMGFSDFMIEARIRSTYTGTYNYITAKLASSPGYAFVSDITTGYLYGVIADGLNDAEVIASNLSVTDGRWHTVQFVVDRSSSTGLKLFVDGVETTYATQEVPTSIVSLDTSNEFKVGTINNSTAWLDEVRVWNFGKDGLPTDYETYITWRAQGRNVFLDISEYDSDAWAGYADADRTDLVTNGDMEADSTWAARGSPTTEEQSTDQANGGSNSWKIISDAAGQGAYQDITTVVDEYYEVTGYLYVTAGDAKLGKEDTDGSDQVLTGQATAAAWTEFNVVFLATETTSRIFFQADATDASTFYADDVSVKRTGLVGHWKFENSYLDEGSNDNDLTAGGTGNVCGLGYTLRHPGQRMLVGV